MTKITFKMLADSAAADAEVAGLHRELYAAVEAEDWATAKVKKDLLVEAEKASEALDCYAAHWEVYSVLSKQILGIAYELELDGLAVSAAKVRGLLDLVVAERE